MYKRLTWPSTFTALLLIGLPTIFYSPALFQGMTQLHGETITVSIPLMDMLWNAVHGESSALWTDHIYGGHPIFAEGQGAFAHPLNLLAVLLFPPVVAYSVFNWLCLIITGIGTYILCRSYNCGRASSLFAVVALTFSGVWLLGRGVLPVSGAITWVPWALWAMNYWLKNTTLKSAGLFGLAMCLMILAGYPQIVHGTVVYLTLYLLVSICFHSKRELWFPSLKKRLLTGFFAIAVCSGLGAVQLIPLFELVGQSHRSDGIDMLSFGEIPLEYFLRGFLYTLEPSTQFVKGSPSTNALFPVFGSVLVCMVASFVIFARKGAEQIAHLAAVAFLLLLAFGTTTPIFALIYNSQLLPGLASFRVMWPYLFVGTVGMVLLTAMAIDDIKCKIESASGEPGFRRGAVIAVWLMAWLAIIFFMHTENVSAPHYVFASLLLIGLALIVHYRQGSLLPLLVLVLVCLDALSLRLNSFAFSSRELVQKPELVANLQKLNLFEDYKVLHNSEAGKLIYRPANHPGFDDGITRIQASLLPASNALWGISNIDGTTALPARRFSLAWPVIGEEVRGEHSAKPGLRLIDFLSLRFIIGPEVGEGTGFYKRIVDWELPVHFVENPEARPKFQVFHNAASVESTEQALEFLSKIEEPVLVLEADNIHDLIDRARSSEGDGFEFNVNRRSTDSYEFTISSEGAAWFFIADANYPGWNAYLNDEHVRVFYAQVLGKAVFIPAGVHVLRVEFEPASFRIGLVITAASMLILILGVFYRFRSRGLLQQ
jgi:hypothetical protein